MPCCYCGKKGTALFGILRDQLHSGCTSNCPKYHTLCSNCIVHFRPQLTSTQVNKLSTKARHQISSSSRPQYSFVTVNFPINNASFKIPVQLETNEISSNNKSEIRIIGNFDSRGLQVEKCSFYFRHMLAQNKESTCIMKNSTNLPENSSAFPSRTQTDTGEISENLPFTSSFSNPQTIDAGSEIVNPIMFNSSDSGQPSAATSESPNDTVTGERSGIVEQSSLPLLTTSTNSCTSAERSNSPSPNELTVSSITSQSEPDLSSGDNLTFDHLPLQFDDSSLQQMDTDESVNEVFQQPSHPVHPCSAKIIDQQPVPSLVLSSREGMLHSNAGESVESQSSFPNNQRTNCGTQIDNSLLGLTSQSSQTKIALCNFSISDFSTQTEILSFSDTSSQTNAEPVRAESVSLKTSNNNSLTQKPSETFCSLSESENIQTFVVTPTLDCGQSFISVPILWCKPNNDFVHSF